MQYISTRGAQAVSGAEAIVRGLAPDGGLYVPQEFPTVTDAEMTVWAGLDYPTLASKVLYKFLPDFGEDVLLDITKKSAATFSVPEVTPLVKVEDGEYFLELWHGPTHAFKDVALTTLPHLLTTAKKMLGIATETVILVATSGDTGKAALEGFRDVAGTKCVVLYPSEGVSPMQKLQMTTQAGKNVSVYAIKGNFDQAQSAVKTIFTDEQLRARLKQSGVELSSANSINLGRLLPQIVYYFSAYFDLVNSAEINYGEKVNFCVPTGNFGDILAGYYARRMGLPVGRLICASNDNNVLTDFLSDGTYTTDREFYKTISPSMDILVSSNLERLLFEVGGRDAAKTADWMKQLSTNRSYTVGEKEYYAIAEVFSGECATQEETKETLADYFFETGYLMDPHTAVAASCYEEYLAESDDKTKTVILSTASPYKFVNDVLSAIDETPGKTLDDSVKKLEEVSALEAPDTIKQLTKTAIRFDRVLDGSEIAQTVESYALGND